jgi:hypothetical protein
VRGAAQAPAVMPLRHMERISAAAFDTAPAGRFRNWLVVHRLMKLSTDHRPLPREIFLIRMSYFDDVIALEA